MLLCNYLPSKARQTASCLADVRAKAEKGDAQSQYQLGHAFANGSLGVAKDQVEAVKWFRKAAEQNLADAQDYLGVCYREWPRRGEG